MASQAENTIMHTQSPHRRGAHVFPKMHACTHTFKNFLMIKITKGRVPRMEILFPPLSSMHMHTAY